MKYVIIAVCILIFGYVLGSRWLMNRTVKKAYGCIADNDEEGCFKMLDESWRRAAFSSYQYLMLRLNCAIAFRSKKRVDECMERFESMPGKKLNQENVLYLAMQFYVDEEDRGKCEEILELLKEIGSEDILAESEILYHVFVLKDDKYMDEMTKIFEDEESDDEQKRRAASYLSIMYGNLGSSKKARQYARWLKDLENKDRGN